MIITVLKTIVMVVVLILVAIVEGIKLLLKLLADAASEAKEQAPSTIATLKEQAGVATVTGSTLAAKANSDLRRIFKLPVKEEVNAN